MPMIPDEDWGKIQREIERLQGRAQVADFVEPILNNPMLSDRAKALIKEQYPNVQITDYELKQHFQKQIDDLKKEREDKEKAKAEEEERAGWEASKQKVKKEYGLTDDGVKELEDFMVKKKIGDYESAAEYYATKNPKQSDAHHSDGLWHIPKDGSEELAKDPEGYARNEFLKAIYSDQERERGGR